MNKLHFCISGCLLLLGCLAQGASAATVQFTQPMYLVSPGEQISLTLEGSGFAVPVDSGMMALNWDPGVLEYAGISRLEPWFDLSADASQSASGQMDFFVLMGFDDPAVGPDFQIADVSFNVIGAVGDWSFVDVFSLGWSEAVGAAASDVETLASEAQVVPLPSALLLLAFPLAGLGLASRRRG